MSASERVHRFFFSAADARELALCRISFFGALFLFYLPLVDAYSSQDISAFADVSEVFRTSLWPREVLIPPVPSASWLTLLWAVWRLSLLCSCLGIATRASTAVAFALSPYLLSLPFSFGKMSHGPGVLVFVLGVMALSRCGDALSIDNALRVGLARANESSFLRRQRPAKPSGEYAWPLRFVWVILGAVYFSAGTSKLLGAGVGWVHLDVLGAYLLEKLHGVTVQPACRGCALWLAENASVRSLLSTMVLAGELLFLPAVLFARTRALFALGAALGHVVIFLLLGPAFFHLLACFVFFLPWRRVLDVVYARRAACTRRDRWWRLRESRS